MKKIVAFITLTFISAAAVAQTTKAEAPKPVIIASMISAAAISDVAINPNPVTGKTFNLQLQNLEKGKYNIYIFNKEGKKYLLKTLNLQIETTTETIELPEAVTSGTYILQVLSKTARFSKKMVVE